MGALRAFVADRLKLERVWAFRVSGSVHGRRLLLFKQAIARADIPALITAYEEKCGEVERLLIIQDAALAWSKFNPTDWRQDEWLRAVLDKHARLQGDAS